MYLGGDLLIWGVNGLRKAPCHAHSHAMPCSQSMFPPSKPSRSHRLVSLSPGA